MKRLHLTAGIAALAIISTFWISAAWSEIQGTPSGIVTVRTSILGAMILLIPAMMITGASGAFMSRRWKSGIVSQKLFRMKIIAANGLLILLPSAVFLYIKAMDNSFDLAFSAVQVLELIAGAVNISLLVLNMKDGFAMRRKLKMS